MPAWSFSGMKLYETCPRKYHAEKVEKLYPFTDTQATIYGKEVHLAAEEYIRDGKPLPKGHEQFKNMLDALNRIEGDKHCELKMALTEDLKPTEFLAKDVWVRGIADLIIINGENARVVDYKTGSAKYPDTGQLELMALMLFAYYPEIQNVKAALVFMVHDVVVKATFSREEYDQLWEKWKGKYNKLAASYEHDNWPPNPNGLCRKWCPVEHCEFQGG